MPQNTLIQNSAESFGHLPDGREVRLFTLKNSNGMVARITEYGAILAGLEVPAQDGSIADVVLGCDNLADLMTNEFYFGATVGRYGNRIADGRFSLDEETFSLATNNDPGGLPCHLHGGDVGFDQKLWRGTLVDGGVEFTYTSPDGEEGFPGELAVVVRYLLTEENELTWQATATTNKATPINIIHHPYWNLSGDGSTSIDDHLLTIHATKYLATGIGLIPTGIAVDVAGTPMDFRSETAIGDRVDHDYQSLTYGNGYDHAYVIEGTGLRPAAAVTDPKTGRTMEVHCDQPGLQFYSGNYITENYVGKGGQKYGPRTGFCLESEHFPNSPNEESFPDCILRPGERYHHQVIYRFSW